MLLLVYTFAIKLSLADVHAVVELLVDIQGTCQCCDSAALNLKASAPAAGWIPCMYAQRPM